MAITKNTIRNGNGVSFTITVDSPSDWSSVTNNTYFKNLSDGLIYYKNVSGTIIPIFYEFTGNTSGTCISDIHVTNIHSCSPININPLDEGNVYFGSSSGVTIDVVNSRVGIGINSPLNELEVNGVISASTISATTFYGNGSNITGISANLNVNNSTISNGNNGRIFFQESGLLQQDSNFNYSITQKRLTLKSVGTASTDIPFAVQNSGGASNLFTVRGDQGIEMIASTPSTNGGILITKTDTYNSPRIQLYNVFSQLTDINGSTITTSNVKVGNSGAAGFIGFVTPVSQDRYLKFINLFGQETLSIGGNNYDGAATFTLKSWAGTSPGNIFTIIKSDNTNPFVITDTARVGIGTNSPQSRLDVRAQGALSTDIAFRVRNSADSIDIFTVNGNGVFYKPHASANNDVAQDVFVSQMSDGRNKIRMFTKGSFNVSSTIGISFQSDAAGSNISSYTLSGAFLNSGGSYRDNGGLSEFNVGTNNVTGYSYLRLRDFGNTNTNIYISRTGTIILNPDNANAQTRGLSIFGGTLGTSADRVVSIGSGTAPTTSTTDAFQLWSDDITTGNAVPHFRTENGSIVKLYKNTAVTTSQGIADALTNLGLLDTSVIDFIPKPDSLEVFRGRTFRYNSTTVDTYGGIATLNNASAAAQITSTTNFFNKFVRLRYYASIVSTGRLTSVRGTDLQWYLSGGFRFITIFRVADTAFGSTCQQFYGLAGTTSELNYGSVSLIQVKTNLNIIGIGNDGSDTNLQIFHNDNAGGDANKIDLGVGFPANRTAGSEMTTMYSVEFYNEVNTSIVKYEVINLETGQIAQGTISTQLPPTTQGLTIHASRAMGTPTTNTGQFELHKWGCSDIIK